MNTLERMPFIAQNAVFRKLAQITDITTLSKADREKYDYSLKNMRDYIATYNTAEEMGIEKGFERGRTKGRAEGKAEGIIETARNFKAIGISYLDIAKATGLSYDEIERL